MSDAFVLQLPRTKNLRGPMTKSQWQHRDKEMIIRES